MYADILNGLIFDAVYGSWILSLLLFTLGIIHKHTLLLEYVNKYYIATHTIFLYLKRLYSLVS